MLKLQFFAELSCLHVWLLVPFETCTFMFAEHNVAYALIETGLLCLIQVIYYK